MKLKIGKLCPLHRRRDCCGRTEVAHYVRNKHTKWETVRSGVRRIKDEFADHPDGYRYRLSPAEMRKVIDRKIQEQGGNCSICGDPLTDYTDVVPDHKLPKGMNGARRDDRESNIGAAHSLCNQEKGSKRENLNG